MFDINAFLEDNSERPPDFADMTWQEKTDLCEKNYKSWVVTNNGGYQSKKNFYCNHYKEGPGGEPPCKICKAIKEKARRNDIRSKVSDAFNGNQYMYMVVTTNADDTRKLGYRVKKRKARYLSIPVGADGERMFIMDMYDEISAPEAVSLPTATSLFLQARNNTEYGNLAGNIDYSVDEIGEDDIIIYVTPTSLSSYPAVDEEFMPEVETEAILTLGVDDITAENAADLIAKKLDLKVKILEECGYKNVKHVGEKEVKVRLAQLKDMWYTARVSVISNLSLDRFPQGIAIKIREAEKEGLRQLKEQNRRYLKNKETDVSDDLSSLGIYGY